MGNLASSPQMPDLSISLFRVMFLVSFMASQASSSFPPTGYSGPLGGRAAAGSHQLLSQLHSPAEAAQETVTAQALANGSHISDFW